MSDPRISEFSPPDLPHIPTLLVSNRKKHRNNCYPASPHSPFIPKEVLVDVTPSQSEKGVRQHIDACLRAIEKTNFGPRLSGKDEAVKTAVKEDGREEKGQSIHRIDNRLINDYLKSIQKDYRIRDPFSASSVTETIPRKEASVDHRKKQYLHLTQSSKREKRALSNLKFQEAATPSRYHNLPRPTSTPSVSSFGLEDRVTGKNSSGLRYCINCEKTVQSCNVERHEREECKDFQKLYELSFPQLEEVVKQKINRTVQQVKNGLKQLRVSEGEETKANRIVSKTLDQLENYLNNFSPLLHSQQQFVKFTSSLTNEYEGVLEGGNKLHWFAQIYRQLAEQKSRNKSEGGRGAGRELPLSPIGQLDPQIGTRLFSS